MPMQRRDDCAAQTVPGFYFPATAERIPRKRSRSTSIAPLLGPALKDLQRILGQQQSVANKLHRDAG